MYNSYFGIRARSLSRSKEKPKFPRISRFFVELGTTTRGFVPTGATASVIFSPGSTS